MRYFAIFLGFSIAICAAAEEDGADETKYFPQQLTAQQLLYACASSSLTGVGRERRRFCAGFVSGVEESFRVLDTTRGSPGLARICAPAGTTAANFSDAYIKHASKITDLSRPAAAVVADALQRAYPCVK